MIKERPRSDKKLAIKDVMCVYKWGIKNSIWIPLFPKFFQIALMFFPEGDLCQFS